MSKRAKDNFFERNYLGIFNDDSLDSLLYSLNFTGFNDEWTHVVIPRTSITNWTREQESIACIPRDTFECIRPYFIDEIDLKENLKEKGKKKMSDFDKILNLYEDIETDRIKKSYFKEYEKILNESAEAKIAKKVEEYALKELKKVFPDYDETKQNIIVVDWNNSDETKKTIEELEKKRKEEAKKADKIIQEARALLELAENYEQKVEILKAYGILDEKGVLKNNE